MRPWLSLQAKIFDAALTTPLRLLPYFIASQKYVQEYNLTLGLTFFFLLIMRHEKLLQIRIETTIKPISLCHLLKNIHVETSNLETWEPELVLHHITVLAPAPPK
jgi:hypothetical protein